MKNDPPLPRALKILLEKYRDELAGHVFTEHPENFDREVSILLDCIHILLEEGQ